MRGVVAAPYEGCRSLSLGGLEDEMLPDVEAALEEAISAPSTAA
jgi:hypothetical protein